MSSFLLFEFAKIERLSKFFVQKERDFHENRLFFIVFHESIHFLKAEVRLALEINFSSKFLKLTLNLSLK